jgi:hypothetical protein
MPERRRLDGNAVSGQTFAHLGQREIGLRGNPLACLQFPIRHPGAPISAKATAGGFTLLFLARFDLINPHARYFQAASNVHRTLPTLKPTQYTITYIL